MRLDNTNCCGLDEIVGLETPLLTLREVCNKKYSEDDWGSCYEQAFILFTDTVVSRRGGRLAEYIKKNKLGSLVHTRAKRNPNSDNRIMAWIWSPHESKLKAWYKSHK